jgi:hypothetical protein
MLEDSHVQFISYTGKYPNLCSGILTLKIDNKEVSFGKDYSLPDSENKSNFNSFWSSGGGCSFNDDWTESFVNRDEWIIYEDDLPEEYQKYAEEIEEVFNENVKHGCCGGCL